MAQLNAAVCGTRNGYQAHQHRREPACDPCKAAAAAYQRRLRERKGLTKRPRLAARRLRRGADVELLPPPATLARCRRRCGRLVWHFERGLCGECGRALGLAA